MQLEQQELGDALRAATAQLAAAGVPTPRVDAELLAAHLLGASRGEVAAMALGGAPAPEGLAGLVERRAQRVPLQHLTGVAYFRYIELAVGPGVFIPRPETESVAQWAIDQAKLLEHARVADLGTGSGAIAGSIAFEVPGAEVFAVELSDEALPYARANLEPLGVKLIQGDLATALGEYDGRFDVIASNPPYIPANAVPREPEVRDHDPQMALYGGGEDGMVLPRAAERSAARLLKPGGFFIMEHAEVQAPAMAALLAGTGDWDSVTTHIDLNGSDRATSGIRR
ncbi:peptide chain release factor N(5)-glutamine methyltransferase [Paeniglutamicibacter cryotolerans]|uniref:Release factor glutamine methyltransferase n=1 Tax=Paeniglutamicibacter cryotolerans TaxID=670079 RepID=A0A839QNL7_9MICC|nr:peptide chain release factor N(5)-glutamine methyltransferase [Paeniglutamicibacter cryotolerans]MBB2996374.1 release factor glutamine methyltransferase [Paeniglutamicibacter cryotolerans]